MADDIGFESLAEVLTPWQVLPLEGSFSLVFHTLYSSWESHRPLLRDKERANYRHEPRGMVACKLPHLTDLFKHLIAPMWIPGCALGALRSWFEE